MQGSTALAPRTERIQRTAAIIELARRYAPEGTKVVADSLVTDGWVNVATGLGHYLRDKRLSASFSRHRVLQQPELESLYAGDWIIRRACSRPAGDQVRRWVEIKVDGKKGSDDDIAQEHKRLELKPKTAEAITWARLHGGALIIMGIDDGRDPEEPVNENAIKGVPWINVIDRWDATVWRYRADTGGYMYGDPEVYQLVTRIIGPDESSMLGMKVHESRVLRFDGILTSRQARTENQGWNHGIVQSVYDIVRDYQAAIGGLAHLTTDFSQAWIRIKGLARMLAEDNDGLVTQRLRYLDMMRSLVRLVPLDEGEEIGRSSTPVTGLPEITEEIRDALCGALDIPEKILFGKATAGLGDQGQSDLEQYYNQIETEQERNVVPQVEKLTRYLYAANGGAPKRWSIKPCSLWTPTEKEVSENRHRDAQTDALNITSGIYDADEARKSRYGGDGYGQNIVIEDDDADELDKITPTDPSAGETGAGPEEVREVTGVVINAAVGVVEKALAGAITVAAARVLLRAALRMTESDVNAMLEGVEEEREQRKAEAAALAEQMAASGGTQGNETGERPAPGAKAPFGKKAKGPKPSKKPPVPPNGNDDPDEESEEET